MEHTTTKNILSTYTYPIQSEKPFVEKRIEYGNLIKKERNAILSYIYTYPMWAWNIARL